MTKQLTNLPDAMPGHTPGQTSGRTGHTSRAIVLRSQGDVHAQVEQLLVSDLPRQGDTLVRIRYSSLNYKDGLAVTGKGKIVRGEYPFVPGIDFVGEVVESASDELAAGAWVIGTGSRIGESFWGGFSQYQWAKADWLVRVPDSLDPRRAMVAGTAGLTAMLSVRVLAQGGRRPADGPVLVTGATGGVGSLAVAFLSRRGYDVVASSGKADESAYLRKLGAAEVIPRSDLSRGALQPLDTSRWSGAIDSVGGTTLEAILSAVKTHGVVASCGLAGGAAFSTTVFPFILRGVSLVGIDSNTCPMAERLVAWTEIGELLDDGLAGEIGHVHALGDVVSLSEDITAGRIRGRAVIDVNA